VTVTVPEQSPGSSGGDYCTSILEDLLHTGLETVGGCVKRH